MPGAASCHNTPSMLKSTMDGNTERLLSNATAFSNEVAPGDGADGSAMKICRGGKVDVDLAHQRYFTMAQEMRLYQSRPLIRKTQ